MWSDDSLTLFCAGSILVARLRFVGVDTYGRLPRSEERPDAVLPGLRDGAEGDEELFGVRTERHLLRRELHLRVLRRIPQGQVKDSRMTRIRVETVSVDSPEGTLIHFRQGTPLERDLSTFRASGDRLFLFSFWGQHRIDQFRQVERDSDPRKQPRHNSKQVRRLIRRHELQPSVYDRRQR